MSTTEKVFVAGVAVFAALAIWVLFFADGPPPAPEEDLPDATADSGTLPPLGDPRSDEAVGMSAPGFTGPNIDGDEVTVGQDGTPRVLFFLAHWCPHCRTEVPKLVEWFDIYDGEVEMVGVATSIASSRPNYPPSRWFDREGFDITTVYDLDESVAEAYGVTGYPFIVFIDEHDEVALRFSGALDTTDLANIVQMLEPAGTTDAGDIGDVGPGVETGEPTPAP